MPAGRAEDERGLGIGDRFGLAGSQHFFDDGRFFLLAIGVQEMQLFGEGFGFDGIVGEEQLDDVARRLPCGRRR